MFSYHRVLGLYGRSVKDRSLECNLDVHPWEISINGQQWAGKIRLIGFIDVFFLIAYSDVSRFERGVIIYKEDTEIRSILQKIGETPKDLEPVGFSAGEPKFFSLKNGPIYYTVESLGHEVGLVAECPKSELRKYTIELRKHNDFILRSELRRLQASSPQDRPERKPERIKRGIKQHSTVGLMQDVVSMGFVTHAELSAELMGRYFAGSVAGDAMRKYMDTLSGGGAGSGVGLANERT